MDAPRALLAADPAFRADVLAGLALPQPAVPARWLYDRHGAELFEEITRQPEYYLTRTETGLLRDHAGEIAACTPLGAIVVEFGAGSAAKTPILLEALAPAAYVPIDICGDFLAEAAAAIRARFPGLGVHPMEADFLHPLALPGDYDGLSRVGFFPGSTIGNLNPEAAVDLLRTMRTTLGEGARLLIGMDRIKDRDLLLAAYDDAAGVTARFNLNLLARINRELDGTIPVEAFRHRIAWNEAAARIEMHLEAMRDIAFTICGQAFAMQAGETIHSENCHKYGPRDARLLLRAGGWTPVGEWTDARDWFSVLLAEAQPLSRAP
ncbi:MAG: L-histidine N(alpha)-methyltransferase [Sphingosinicella sp.]